jgi:hypothetical protein
VSATTAEARAELRRLLAAEDAAIKATWDIDLKAWIGAGLAFEKAMRAILPGLLDDADALAAAEARVAGLEAENVLLREVYERGIGLDAELVIGGFLPETMEGCARQMAEDWPRFRAALRAAEAVLEPDDDVATTVPGTAGAGGDG